MHRYSIEIICEGQEEEDYLNRLIDFNIFNNDLYCIKVKNAKGAGKIPAIYQNEFSKNIYNLILVFCDADKGADTYKNIINKLNSAVFGKRVASEIVIFVNPVTLQIVLSHFQKVSLKSQSKKVNAEIVEELTKVKNYKGSDDQRKEIINMIHRSSYEKMKENIKDLSTDYEVIPSSNIKKFLDYLESDNGDWIDEINKKI